jgi:hypothetical protein
LTSSGLLSSSVAQSGADFFDAHAQLVKVRTAPIDVAAPYATPKLFITDPGQRLELIDHLFFGGRSEK